MADDLISNTKAWFTLNPDQQQAVTELEFQDRFSSGKNTLYNKATPAAQAKIKQAFHQVIEEGAYNSEHNPKNIEAIAAQEKADNSGFLPNLITQIGDSHSGLYDQTKLFSNMAANGANTEFNKNFAAYAEKKKGFIVTKAAKELAVQLKPSFDQFPDWDTFTNDPAKGLKDAAISLGKITGAVITNPAAAMDIAAQSSSSMTAMGGGALAGTGLGIVTSFLATPAAGAIVGSAARKVLAGGAEAVTATAQKYSELLENRLKELQLDPTPTNVSIVTSDKEWNNTALKDSVIYGSTMAAADQGIAATVTKLAEGSKRAATATIRAGLTEGDHAAIALKASLTGKPIEAATTSFIDSKAAAVLAAASFKSKVLNYAGRGAAEIASEPVTEAASKASIGEKVTIEDLTYETIGGIGSAPFGVALNQSLYGTKLATDKAINIGKSIINSTPETKAMNAEHKASMAEVKDLVEKPAEPHYKAKVASIDSESDEFIGLTDSTNKDTYNPKKAIDVLANTTEATPDTLNKALDIADAYMDSLTPLYDKVATLDKKENRTYAEEQDLKNAKELLFTKNEFANSLYNTAETLKARIKGTSKPTAINADTDAIPDILEKLGSHGTGNSKKHVTIAQLDTAINRTDIDADSKKLLEAYRTAKVTRETIESPIGKSTEQVSSDIYNGKRGSSFKGIDDYQQGINYFLSPLPGQTTPRNEAKAKADLNGLKKFAEAHNEKAKVTAEVMALMKQGKETTLEQQQYLIKHGLDLHPIKSAKLVANIQQEAIALNNEVKLAKMTYKRLTSKTNTTTSTPASSPSTETVAKPTAAPVVSATPVITAHTFESAATALNTGGQITFPAAGHPDVIADSKAGQFDLQRQLHKAGYVRIVDPTKKTATFKQSAEQESKAKAETSKPSPVTAPQSDSKSKDIQAPATEEIAVSTASQESTVDPIKHERLTSLGIDNNIANQILNNPDITTKELTDLALTMLTERNTTGNYSDIKGFVESVRNIVEKAPVDVLEAFDEDIKINMGTEANPIMMTYEEAITDNKLKLKEAEAVLKCTQA